MSYDMSSWEEMAEADPAVTLDKDNGVIKRYDAEQGLTFEFDPISGKSALYYDNGEYFRSTDDYDHGWIYKNPDMKYGQVRRKKRTVFFDRLLAVWIAGYITLFPAYLLAGIPNKWVAVPLVVGWLSFGAYVVMKLAKTRAGQHTWYGRLYDR